MPKFIVAFILMCFFQQSFAQKKAASYYAEKITQSNLKKQLTIIAADDMEGRETGTNGQRKAAAYIASQFDAIGLQKAATLDSYEQFYPLFRDSLTEASLSVNGQPWEMGKDFVYPLNQNESGSFSSKEWLFVGYGISDSAYNDYANLDVKGRVVVMMLGEPKKEGKFFIHPEAKASAWTIPGLPKKMALAKARGAAAAIVINPLVAEFPQRQIDNAKKSNLYYPSKTTGASQLNILLISHAAASKLLGASAESSISRAKAGEVFSTGSPSMNMAIEGNYKKNKERVEASNVVGIVEGTDKKDEYLFLTAHYDHLGIRDGKIYNGADDDGSGTVAVIEMAAAFAQAKKEGNGPRRTIVFMTVSGEEKGLWGSEYYTDHPFYPLEKTTADLNTDMIGRTDTERKTADTLNYVYVVGHDKISTDLPIINEASNSAHTGLVLDYKFDDPNDPNRIYFRSDHYNFARKGVPVLFFYDGMLKSDYHKPTDDIEWINWPLFEKRARMIFFTAWEMANREGLLIRDKPLPTATR